MTDENEEDDNYEPEQPYLTEPHSTTERAVGLIFALGIIPMGAIMYLTGNLGNSILAGAGGALLAFVLGGFRINKQYEESAIFRFGVFKGMRKEGIYFVTPFISSIKVIDTRVRSTSFAAQETLTSDNIPVDVTAVIFWRVSDTSRAVLAVQDFGAALENLSLATLRDVVGRSLLNEMLSKRQAISKSIQDEIGPMVEKWGTAIASVELTEVKIPKALQDAMSRQAQAQREKEARITLAEAETKTAQLMQDAATIYQQNPEALKLRWMNQIHEIGLNGEATIILMPADMPTVGVASALALAKEKKDA